MLCTSCFMDDVMFHIMASTCMSASCSASSLSAVCVSTNTPATLCLLRPVVDDGRQQD